MCQTGIHETMKSILCGWGTLCIYKAILIRNGCGYTPYYYEEDSDDKGKDVDGQADAQCTYLLLLDNPQQMP